MSANDRQEGGNHYRQHGETGEQHWDRVARLGLDYFQACITKYVERWKDKGGVLDLKKARHFLDKYIELQEAKLDSERISNGGFADGGGPGNHTPADVPSGGKGDPPRQRRKGLGRRRR